MYLMFRGQVQSAVHLITDRVYTWWWGLSLDASTGVPDRFVEAFCVRNIQRLESLMSLLFCF